MMTYEKKEDNNFKDFSLTKMEKILSIKKEIYYIDDIFI